MPEIGKKRGPYRQRVPKGGIAGLRRQVYDGEAYRNLRVYAQPDKGEWDRMPAATRNDPNRVYVSTLLTEPQRRIDRSTARFIIVKAGRRFGKSRYARYWLLKKLFEKVGTGWYVAKTYSLVREEIWPGFLEEIPRELILRVDERLMTIYLVNGSKLICKTAEKEDNLRGRGLIALVVDEGSFVKPTLWNTVLRPTLADHQGPALIISSPRIGWFTKQFADAKAGKDAEWEGFHFTVYDNPHIAREEIEKIRAHTSIEIWQQEYMAEEVDYCGQVYHEFADASVFALGQAFPGHEKQPGVIAIDWGKRDETGVVFLHVLSTGAVVLSDEHVRAGLDVGRHAAIIRQKAEGRSVSPRDYVIDRSAWRQDSASHISIADQFRAALALPNQLQASERDLNATRDLLKRFLRGDGENPWLYIAGRCTETIRALQAWEWGEHEPDVLAALRYGLAYLVYRRMTPLAELLPRGGGGLGKDLEEDVAAAAERIAAVRLQRANMNRAGRRQWGGGWDHEAGGRLG